MAYTNGNTHPNGIGSNLVRKFDKDEYGFDIHPEDPYDAMVRGILAQTRAGASAAPQGTPVEVAVDQAFPSLQSERAQGVELPIGSMKDSEFFIHYSSLRLQAGVFGEGEFSESHVMQRDLAHPDVCAEFVVHSLDKSITEAQFVGDNVLENIRSIDWFDYASAFDDQWKEVLVVVKTMFASLGDGYSMIWEHGDDAYQWRQRTDSVMRRLKNREILIAPLDYTDFPTMSRVVSAVVSGKLELELMTQIQLESFWFVLCNYWNHLVLYTVENGYKSVDSVVTEDDIRIFEHRLFDLFDDMLFRDFGFYFDETKLCRYQSLVEPQVEVDSDDDTVVPENFEFSELYGVATVSVNNELVGTVTDLGGWYLTASHLFKSGEENLITMIQSPDEDEFNFGTIVFKHKLRDIALIAPSKSTAITNRLSKWSVDTAYCLEVPFDDATIVSPFLLSNSISDTRAAMTIHVTPGNSGAPIRSSIGNVVGIVLSSSGTGNNCCIYEKVDDSLMSYSSFLVPARYNNGFFGIGLMQHFSPMLVGRNLNLYSDLDLQYYIHQLKPIYVALESSLKLAYSNYGKFTCFQVNASTLATLSVNLHTFVAYGVAHLDDKLKNLEFNPEQYGWLSISCFQELDSIPDYDISDYNLRKLCTTDVVTIMLKQLNGSVVYTKPSKVERITIFGEPYWLCSASGVQSYHCGTLVLSVEDCEPVGVVLFAGSDFAIIQSFLDEFSSITYDNHKFDSRAKYPAFMRSDVPSTASANAVIMKLYGDLISKFGDKPMFFMGDDVIACTSSLSDLDLSDNEDEMPEVV